MGSSEDPGGGLVMARPLRSSTRRVVIVDDDAWMRRGRESWLLEAEGVEVLASLSPQEAMHYAGWQECDVALVDAWDDRETFDRFPGVRVVERIRQERTREETIIVVISGHVLDDLLRLRMAEAGADFFYGAGEVPDLDTLLQVIKEPAETRRVTPGDPLRLAPWGLNPESRPNAALQHIVDKGLEEAFTPGAPQREVSLSRRRIITARQRIATLAKMHPAASTRSGRPLRAPEWRAVVRFVNRARGADDPEDAP
jgi:DNA-binding NarL/FixJ family response regulator